MGNKHINLLYPQWQGGGDRVIYSGAMELKALYLNSLPLEEIPVSEDEAQVLQHGIFGYETIVKQMSSVCGLLHREKPDTLFVVGGGCDVSAPAISYLNARHNGQLTVLWLDAHGDLNTPESSPSGLFHGMPLRLLLGEGDQRLLELLDSSLNADQVVLAGVRDLDEPERQYVDQYDINLLAVKDLCHPQAVLDKLQEKGNKHVYIHIDLDVLEPSAFDQVPFPVVAGLEPDTLTRLLQQLCCAFTVAGLSVVEYAGGSSRHYAVLEEIVRLGTGLNAIVE